MEKIVRKTGFLVNAFELKELETLRLDPSEKIYSKVSNNIMEVNGLIRSRRIYKFFDSRFYLKQSAIVKAAKYDPANFFRHKASKTELPQRLLDNLEIILADYGYKPIK